MKKRILTEKEQLLTAFDLVYANICHIFITKNKTQYVVVQKGFKIQKDIEVCSFDKNICIRHKFYTLGEAVLRFNYLVGILCSTFDWFQPDFFNQDWFKKNCLDVY